MGASNHFAFPPSDSSAKSRKSSQYVRSTVCGDLAGVIAQRTAEVLVLFGDGVGRDPVFAEESINGRGRFQHVELPQRVGPLVFFAAGEEHRSRCAERDEAILIEGQLLFVAVELFELRVEPMRKDGLIRLTLSALGLCCRLGAEPPQPA